ncbi:MAG: hypothetical protein IJA67_09305 [Oscillospiraceae bacterium]|nr:hypothetical protein [Oscillospiraceae bacterium]
MGVKENILAQLRVKGSMTQLDLSEAIYGDRKHGPNVYPALMSLVSSGAVLRKGANPARYSLSGNAEPPTAAVTAPKREGAVRAAGKLTGEAAAKLIWDYHSETVRDGHGRYLSWQHCYQAFSEYRHCTDEKTVDYLALHLAFYLASWGMYRGSSFLLQKDYKVHIPVVKILQEEQYIPLVGISAENLCEERNLDLLDALGQRIRDCYAKEKPSFEGSPNNATDTLITKILLGTLGCVPAYDRYYVQSVKKNNVSSGLYNRNSVRDVARFYCAHKTAFEALRQRLSSCGVEYPPMKLMDMCFWQDAYVDDMIGRE